MKQVRETSAGKSISAFVILNKKGEHVATVQAHHANSGRVSVDVWNLGDKACTASYMTARATGALSKKDADRAVESAPAYYLDHSERESWAAHDLFGLQQYSAGGSGYDTFTAALAGLIVDGHTLADHSGLVPEDDKKRTALLKKYQRDPNAHGDEYWREKAHAIGCRWANWTTDGWRSLHFIGGLDRLERLGYRVIQAI